MRLDKLLVSALTSLSGAVSHARARHSARRARLAEALGLATRDEVEALIAQADLLEGRVASLRASLERR